MYLPLKFLEMVDEYIVVPGAKSSVLKELNEHNIRWVKSFMQAESDFFYDTYAQYKDFVVSNRKDIPFRVNTKWHQIAEAYQKELRIVVRPDEDFLNTILFTHLRNEWREKKLVYRISKDLKEELSRMKLNKLVSLDCMQNLPSFNFYIDYSNTGGFTGEDDGCMVTVHKSQKAITTILTLCFDREKVGTVIASLGIDLSDSNDKGLLFVHDEDAYPLVNVSVEGTPLVFREKEFKRFILNFFIYLYAINSDITVSEKTRNTYRERKPQSEPKNKFKEVQAFDVGFNYVNPRKSRIKYTNSGNTNSSYYRGTPKCTHYRSAHWHHYWVKEGDKKKLIVKWIDGVMVNGSEAKKVTITKI